MLAEQPGLKLRRDETKDALLSIIIPTYNSAAHINHTLKKILQQTFPLFEILIIDNLSTDSTISIIHQNYGFDNRLKVYSAKDEGIYDAMNKGVSLAKGEWIYFMGADDELVNDDVLSKFFIHLNNTVDIMYGDIRWVPENIMESGVWEYKTFLSQNINHQRIFYRKSLFKKYGKYNVRYKIAADHELNIRFFCNGDIQKSYIPVTIANYHSGGFSSQKTDEAFWDDWDKIVYQNFKPYLSRKIIYSSLGIYCRYLIDKKKIIKATAVMVKVFLNTFNVGFIKLMGSYLFRNYNKRVAE